MWLCLRSSSSASTSAEALPRKPPGGRRIIAAAALRGQFPADASAGQKFGCGARHAAHQVDSGHGPRTTASHSSRSHRPAHFPAAAGRLHHRGWSPRPSVGRGLSFDEILTKKAAQNHFYSAAAKTCQKCELTFNFFFLCKRFDSSWKCFGCPPSLCEHVSVKYFLVFCRFF